MNSLTEKLSSNRSILVTGCAGFIGFHLAKRLLKKNINVIGLDNINDYYDVNLKLSRLSILKKYKKLCICKSSSRR